MKTKTITDYYPGCIGQMLRRHEARERRRFKRRNHPWKLRLVAALAGVLAGFGTAYSLFWLVRFLVRL